jgi:N-acyl homoserine lactone hydrolase
MKHSTLLAGFFLAASYCRPGSVRTSETAENPAAGKIYALKYGESLYPANLVNTASKKPNIRLNWLAYLVERGDGGKTLIDCGFSDPKLLKRFGIQKFRPLTATLADLKIAPEKIDTIVLTHTHFDHALDIDKFPNARIILHASEFMEPEEQVLTPILKGLNERGKIQTIRVATEIAGLHIEPVMGHTKGSLALRMNAAGREIVFSGDECYFSQSCREKIPLPPGAVYSAAANRRFIESLTPQTVVLTGHETDLKEGRWLNDYVFLFLFF